MRREDEEAESILLLGLVSIAAWAVVAAFGFAVLLILG